MDILYYRRMLADRTRVQAFRRAIQKTVRPGDVVVEIGAGLGTYSFFAAKAGARRVYAIEANPEVRRLAECLAEQNGLADKIQFLQGYSTDIELPERADVAIFEDYTSFFFSSRLPNLLRDVRHRLIKQNGCLIPQGVNLFLAPAENARIYRELNLPRREHDRLFGLDFSETHRVAMNLPVGTYATERHLLTLPLRCARISLGNGRNFSFSFAGTSRVRRDGILHGLLGWMELDLAAGVRLSCSPLRPRTVWGQNFYPFTEPLRVRKRESLKVSMELIFPKGISRYIQRWMASTGAEYREGNTFSAIPFSENSPNGQSRNARAQLGPRSRALLTILSELHGGKSLDRIAATLMKKHPHFFDSRDDALAALGRLVPAISTLAGDL